ncbi:MAG TPA: glycosyltransferase family 2 protein [Thermomicrobiales bacterium]|nr:glycosyltransferase family 2 protein [Thermomicrobiales bacterium]
MPQVDVLIPTINRLPPLVMTLTGIVQQTYRNLRVIVADQNPSPLRDEPVIDSLCRMIEARGGHVEWHHRTERHGVGEQRDFLLRHATARYVLFLDDDILMEPWVLTKLVDVLEREECGFAGAFPVQPAYLDDHRPEQEAIDWWNGPVQPETVNPGSPAWGRANLHRAANLYHVSERLPAGEHRLYKVAWLGGCALYDRVNLLQVGGFAFWQRLPAGHAGEDVLVQNLLMRRWGGCGLIPSGTSFAEVTSTVPDSDRRVESHALALLPEMIERYAPGTELPTEDAWKYW